MCLDTVDKEPRRKWGKGYKVVVSLGGKFKPRYFDHRQLHYPLGEWIEQTDTYLIATSQFGAYPAGFHLFTRQEDAKDWNKLHCTTHAINGVVLATQFKNVVATGKQNGFNVVVARKIKLEKVS